jgi:acetoin utilization protein AcuB
MAHLALSGVSLAAPLLPRMSMNTEKLKLIRQFPTVREYMSASPLTISAQRSLAAAESLMRQHGIRHLPVLDGGKVVGLLSERDLLLVESMPQVNPTVVRVEEAMVQNVFQACPDDPVGEVAETMIERKLGSAVVVDGAKVVGVFTTIDALRSLRDLLSAA